MLEAGEPQEQQERVLRQQDEVQLEREVAGRRRVVEREAAEIQCVVEVVLLSLSLHRDLHVLLLPFLLLHHYHHLFLLHHREIWEAFFKLVLNQAKAKDVMQKSQALNQRHSNPKK